MTINKAVIPAAGLGTRFLPATKAMPKEMIALVDKPLIEYVVEEAYAAGISEVILVTHVDKPSLSKHFVKDHKLEAKLIEQGKDKLLNATRKVCPAGLKITAVNQDKPLGLGHAILCAEQKISGEDFVVILPDVLLYKESKPDLRNMLDRFSQTCASQVMVNPVSPDVVGEYGIVDCDNESISPGDSKKVIKVVEKPKAHLAPSNLAITGRYVLSSNIMAYLKQIKPGTGGEIQLTDAIARLIETDEVEAYHINSKIYDCGNKLGYLKATVEYGLRHSELGVEFKEFLDKSDLS